MDGGPYVDRSQLMCRGCGGGGGGGGGGGAGCAIAIVVVVLFVLLKGCRNKTRKQRIPTGESFFRYWTCERPLKECRSVRAGTPATEDDCEVCSTDNSIVVNIAVVFTLSICAPCAEECGEVDTID